MVGRCEDTPAARRRREPVATKLHRIACKARKEPEFKFTSLYHLMNEDLLRGCFAQLRGDAAAGIDGKTKAEYAENLEANVAGLVSRLHRMAYRPQAVRRVYIPKPGSDKGRPLGIPALEDKLVQSGMSRILEQIYEQDFIEDSYGFRAKRSCHDALRALSVTVESGRIGWIVEADIKGFFDNVDHDWLMRFLALRIGDRRMLRMVKRFLKAGVLEEGKLYASEEGVPQGGSISPILSNIYLHYVLDLWFEKGFRRVCGGAARLIRYADDFVACFATQADAERFNRELVTRLARFGLEVEPAKTKVLAFGPDAARRARREGKRKPETFDFLGFTHYCSRTRNGRRYRMKRVTARKKFRVKLAAMKEWLKENRAKMTTLELWQKVCEKLRGHYGYYGVTDNSRGIGRFHEAVKKLLYKWLNRRSQRKAMTWEKFNLMEGRFPLPRPRITVNLFARPKAPVQIDLL
ncbi:MAG: group II intron reverse transcriptase/maturase [Candidatus Hydrogenedentes bacterium]|nr:group II intron reverse transcriptase/maturase [Candidatus Hydrogenedentota bacterium]